MIVHTGVDKFEDGFITAITPSIMESDIFIHLCSFDISDGGTLQR